MKLSGVIALAAFLIMGVSVIVFVMSIFSDDSNKAITMMGVTLVGFNALVALGIAELLEKADKSKTEI